MGDKQQNILVVDDNKMMLDGIQRYLEYLDYPSTGVTRVDDEVVENLKKGRYSLIMLDVMLSGADGRDLVRKFKKTDETRDIPILMISAFHDIEKSVKEAGADDFLVKPFDLDELQQKLERHLDNGQ
ncbi:MAG: response regulator [Balneolaceae bacterium]